MKVMALFVVIPLLLSANLVLSDEQKQADRYIGQHKFSNGLTAVVAEGDFEPRSIGSYSLRLYGANSDFPADNFLYGLVRARDGSVEKVMIQDINQDGNEEVVVIIRSAGTGGYLSADAFRVRSKQLSLIGYVAGLDKRTDPVQELNRILQIKKEN